MLIWPRGRDGIQKFNLSFAMYTCASRIIKSGYIHIRPISMRAVLLIQLNNSQVKCVIPYLLVADSCHLPEVCRMLRKLKRGRKGKKRTSSKKGGGGTLQEMGKERISFLVLVSHGPS